MFNHIIIFKADYVCQANTESKTDRNCIVSIIQANGEAHILKLNQTDAAGVIKDSKGACIVR